MKPRVHQAFKSFLSSPEATASAFSSIGWDVERSKGEHTYWCLVNYGILEEMEIALVAHTDGSWYAELYIPPIMPQYEAQADEVCAQLMHDCPPLVATIDMDRSVLLGVAGEGDPLPLLRALWHAFDEDVVYQSVLWLCGLSAPTEYDVGFDVPDNPFDE